VVPDVIGRSFGLESEHDRAVGGLGIPGDEHVDPEVTDGLARR
jgi:hypothetical protein